ncbi:MAG: lipocalin-like domain-containing protein [Armatimonadota bacterium]
MNEIIARNAIRKFRSFVVCLALSVMVVQGCPGQVQFAKAISPRAFVFPADHAAHPNYGAEWWYYTGIVRTSDNRQFGYQLTFFRVALTPSLANRTSKWATRDILFAHFTVSDIRGNRFLVDQKTGRPVLKIAGYSTKKLDVFIGDWAVVQQGDVMRLSASNGTRRLDLRLTPERQPMANGTNGLSRKGPGLGNANYYYSMPRLKTTGSLVLDGKRFTVGGMSWMDHEWGTSSLTPNQKGWDWFSLRLSDGRDLMLYQLRDRAGRPTTYSSGTLAQPDGKRIHLTSRDFTVTPVSYWISPTTRARYPSGWTFRAPKYRIDLTATPLMKNQELVTTGTTGVTYWEGAIAATGMSNGKRVIGEGYGELTGYAEGHK